MACKGTYCTSGILQFWKSVRIRVGTKIHIQISRKRKFIENLENIRENYEIFAIKFLWKFRWFHFRENIKPIFAKISFNLSKKNTLKLWS